VSIDPPLPTLPLRIRVNGRHPRFFRRMVGRPDQRTEAGGLVRVVDRDGVFVGVGFFNPRTLLCLRLLTHDDEPVGERFFVRRLQAAVELRERGLSLPETGNAYRLVHGEGDGLPGLILDRLGDFLVAQVHALGILPFLEPMGVWLKGRYPGARLVLTVDDRARELEGIEGMAAPGPLQGELNEWGIAYRVRPGGGHKTGFFCDQRDNRRFFADRCRGRRVLDLCTNSGGFALVALRHGGASDVVGYDLDEAAVELARENARRNQLPARFEQGDLFTVLRDLQRGRFDCIVLDPPKWAAAPEQVEAAAARYRDANRLALQALDSGGHLLTCSCSGSLSEDRFLGLLRDAAALAGRDAQVLAVRGAGPDHPVALECPETRYLKAVLLRVR
jgi:23S rRNA (cytosine1962-C5)-methyltransferase